MPKDALNLEFSARNRFHANNGVLWLFYMSVALLSYISSVFELYWMPGRTSACKNVLHHKYPKDSSSGAFLDTRPNLSPCELILHKSLFVGITTSATYLPIVVNYKKHYNALKEQQPHFTFCAILSLCFEFQFQLSSNAFAVCTASHQIA